MASTDNAVSINDWDTNEPIPAMPDNTMHHAPSLQAAYDYLQSLSSPIQAAITHMPGAGVAQAAIPFAAAIPQIAGSNLYGVGRAAAEGQYGTPQAVNTAKQYAGQAMEATNPYLQPQSQEGRDILGGVNQAFETAKIPPYIGHMPRASLSPHDIRVMYAEAKRAGKEFGDIWSDFQNAQAGIRRQNEFGEPTMGVKAQAAAQDVGDIMARRQAAGKSPIPGVPSAVSDALGSQKANIFHGEGSSLFDPVAAAEAQRLEAQGATNAEMKRQTGTQRNRNNALEQELSDKEASINPGFMQTYIDYPELIDKGHTHDLADVLNHPTVFAAYPHLKEVKVSVEDHGTKYHATYDPTNNIIAVNSRNLHDPAQLTESVIHEIQHAIDRKEGWEKGGDSSMFPSAKLVNTARVLEDIMAQRNVSAVEAAKVYESIYGTMPDKDTITYAQEGQASLSKYSDPANRYYNIAGESHANTPIGRMDLSQSELNRVDPYAHDPKDPLGTIPETRTNAAGEVIGRGIPFGVDPDKLLFRSSMTPGGRQLFSNKPKPLKNTVPTPVMQSALATKPSIEASVKQKGGNWLDRTLNNHLRTLKQGINPSLAPDSFNLAPNWRDTANEIGFTPEHQEEFAKTAALNQFVDRRLSPYIKNEMGTPTDSVRDLADQGISHLQDLQFEPWISESTYDKRRAANMPTEGYAKNDAGKEWEMRTDEAIKNTKAGSAANSPANLEDYPWVRPLANKNPNAPIHAMPNRDEFNELGFDHLMDELRSSITGNVPQHLALTIKDLERMTLPEAVRHVAKINEYREAQMSKTAAKSMEDFPAVKVYADKSKWHDLKLPEISTELPEGYTVYEVHGTRWDAVKHEDVAQTAYNVRDDKGYATGNESYSLESSIKEFNEKHAYTKLDDVLKNEGKMMGHCVGNYTDEVASGNTKILTLRDKSNQPHATIELSVVAPRFDDLPPEVKAMGGPEQDQWIKDNPTVVLNQAKGKSNKPVIDKYQSQLLDLLNNPPNVHTIYSITDEGRHDLAGAGIIDRNDTKSVMDALMSPSTDIKGNRMEAYNQVLAQKPDLPRFMSDTDFIKLFKKQKLEGHKHGGIIHMKQGGHVTIDQMKYALLRNNHG